MDFAGLNYLAILAAAVAAFIFGSVYYGTLGKPWMKAARIEPEEAKMEPSLFITSFVAELIMAWVLAGVIGHLGAGQVTLWNGVISGAFIWLGFMATTVAVNQRYEGFGWNLTLIDAGHWLGVALIMGGVIGFFGV
ncbi:DUF1761 domain-containing protein [uncultured Nitratireductor sp.]|uniref:DUF1761 domain-containing protein n=1 Tax=uncultured Nitratireductor sp. TaxID=520953 RepID=UPI0026000388|nr:DUF1761 domain-containing protein [uncultured Nitratireductor sp.]